MRWLVALGMALAASLCSGQDRPKLGETFSVRFGPSDFGADIWAPRAWRAQTPGPPSGFLNLSRVRDLPALRTKAAAPSPLRVVYVGHCGPSRGTHLSGMYPIWGL
jgi:hypothetical protein